MAASSSAVLDCLDESGKGLRVEFEKQADRYRHTILSVTEGQTLALLQSIEGTSEELAPASPPFLSLIHI